jgi:VCBS repeat protein/Big-like domain-containing protein
LSSRISFWFALVSCLGLLASCGGGNNTPPTPPTPTLQTISVSPSGASVVAGKTQQYSAQGSYSDGTTKALSGPDWTTSDSTIATISSSGLLTAVKQGSVTVSATSGSVSGSTSATIGAAQLVSIAVSPQSPSLRINNDEQFVATGTFTDGTMQPLSNVTWNSSATNFATIDNTGLAVGVSPGVSTIQATSGTISGSTGLTVFAPSAPAFSYVTGQTFSSGDTNPRGVVLADYNGDGKIDIAVSNFNSNTIAVFLNDGTGHFGTPITTNVTTTANLGVMVGGDFNEDGKPDLVVSTIDGGSQVNLVLLGNGDGTFAQQPAILNSFGFLSASVADINGDGHQDLVLGMNGSVAISLGRGDGTFIDTVSLPAVSALPQGGAFLGISVADFNGDGKLDVVASAYSGFIVFYAGNGDGTFSTPTSMSTSGLNLTSQANGDFDGDGKQDLLVGLVNGAVIYPGKGDGSFDLTNFEFVYSENANNSSGGVPLIATDLASTGKPDAVTVDYTTGVLQIALNESLGLIAPANGIFQFSPGAGLNGVAAADLNGDGIKDVVVINGQTGQVTTVLSQK